MDRLGKIFQDFEGPSIFINQQILSPDFIPKELPHREKEILKLGAILVPSLKNLKCSNSCIYGKKGTGKTLVSRYVLGRLFEKSQELGKNLKVCYLNCKTTNTEYRIFSAMCSAIGVKVPFTGLATSEIIDRFKEGLESLAGTFIGILDEIDSLSGKRGDELLYQLTRIDEEIRKSSVILVLIWDTLDFKGMLSSSVLSSLSGEEILFEPYNKEQLYNILLQRVELAFKKGTIPETTLRLIATAAHGNAQRAINLLQFSAQIAERKGAKVISKNNIKEAQRKIKCDRVKQVISSLPIHSKILLFALQLRKKEAIPKNIYTGNLYKLYLNYCHQLKINPLTQRRVSQLIAELKELGLISAERVSLGRYGRTKKLKLESSKEIIKEAFAKDPIFVRAFKK